VRATIPLHAVYNLVTNFPLVLLVLTLFQPDIAVRTSTMSAPPAAIAAPATAITKDIFSGGESMIAGMNNVNLDCSSGPIPEVRVVSPPIHGSMRTARTIVVASQNTDNLARCNGKLVDAAGVYYKSTVGFVGVDTVTVDVDFRYGTIRRFVYTLNVR
jgi:hypothetical protein